MKVLQLITLVALGAIPAFALPSPSNQLGERATQITCNTDERDATCCDGYSRLFLILSNGAIGFNCISEPKGGCPAGKQGGCCGTLVSCPTANKLKPQK